MRSHASERRLSGAGGRDASGQRHSGERAARRDGCAVLAALGRFKNPRHLLAGVVAGLALSAPAWCRLEQVPLSALRRQSSTANRSGRCRRTALWAVVMPNGFGNPLRHKLVVDRTVRRRRRLLRGPAAAGVFVAALVAPRRAGATACSAPSPFSSSSSP